MNDNSNTGGMIGFFGGAILVVVLGSMLIKFVTAAIEELGKLFVAVGHGASGFAIMLFGIAKVLVIVAAVVGAVYMTWKYIKLVKKVTEIREEFDQKEATLTARTEYYCETLDRELRRDFAIIQRRLDEVLKPPAPVPPPSEIPLPETKTIPADTQPQIDPVDQDPEQSLENGEPQEFEASNPY